MHGKKTKAIYLASNPSSIKTLAPGIPAKLVVNFICSSVVQCESTTISEYLIVAI